MDGDGDEGSEVFVFDDNGSTGSGGGPILPGLFFLSDKAPTGAFRSSCKIRRPGGDPCLKTFTNKSQRVAPAKLIQHLQADHRINLNDLSRK
jgi:hypothetical protein